MLETLHQLWHQLLTTLIVTLLCISIGLGIGWTSPYLALLSGEDTPFPVTPRQISWIASLLPLGRIFGAVIGAIFVQLFGSKMSLFLTGMPLIVGWICVIFANSVIWLYTFRIFAGMSMGMLFACCPLYVGEIALPWIRGALVTVIMHGMLIGSLFGNIMGPRVILTIYGIVSLTVTAVYIAAFLFLPHSPHYFMQQNDKERAEQAIQWYYRKDDVTEDLEAVERFVLATSALTLRERCIQIKEPKNRRAFTIIILLFMFMQLSGLNTIMFYMEIIVRGAMVTSILPSTVVIITNATGIVVTWIGAYAIDRYGRRILLTISTFCVMISMFLLGLHYLMLNYDYNPADMEWMVILSLLIFMLLFLGLLPVPNTLLSELFASDMKSKAGFVSSGTTAIFAFISTKTYQPLSEAIGSEYVFWLYALIMLICFIYSYLWIPETKGKTVQEIQDMMAAGSTRRRLQWAPRLETEDTITRYYYWRCI